MSELKKADGPVIGKGSPAGPRWFVAKNPGFVAEVVPQKYPKEGESAPPYIRVPFRSEDKSDLHIGDGRLGSRNKTGSDTNANRRYGVFFVMDPGPRPKDGYKDDDELVLDGKGAPNEAWTRTAEQKAEDRKVIDHLRTIYAYRNTPQDNQYRVTGRLIELNWDPAEIRIHVNSLVIPGMNKPMPRPPLAGAPSDSRAEVAVGSDRPKMGNVNVRRNAP